MIHGFVRRPLAVFALAYLGFLSFAAASASWLAPYDALKTDMNNVLSGPSREHLLGTDALGRDVLSRLMLGGQVSLTGVVLAVATFLLLGVTAGLIAGFAGGWTDRAVSWVVDLVIALPGMVVLLVVLAIYGANNTVAMITVGILSFPSIARVVRAATLAVRNELYVSAARVAGLPSWRIVLGQILPRVTGPVLVQASLAAGAALLTQAGLSFLGLIAQPPTPTWGGMISEASQVIARQSWLLIPPGVVVGCAILAFALIGDAIRDVGEERERPLSGGARRRGMRASTPSRHVYTTPVSLPADSLLSVRGLTVTLPGTAGPVRIIEDVAFDVGSGETIGLVGESGCGKSMTGRAVLGLLPEGGQISSGIVVFDRIDLTGYSSRAWRDVRGSRIALVSQEPVGSLDPVFPVGRQVEELVRRHHGGTSRVVRARSLELLASVRLPDPTSVARRYPHELSGGMAQRVSIAMALSGDPDLLIADEPTTALDVTVQAEILDLLRDLQRDRGMAVVLVSHDWEVIARMCERVYVMYAGQVVESGTVAQLTDAPRHPYTAGLLACRPGRTAPRAPLPTIPGSVPDPESWPTGCRFAARCPLSGPECTARSIEMFPAGPGQRSRCLHHAAVSKEPVYGRLETA
ncbi:dipeptide/oligopeptide/nickel ABC transporter permease/ATP-binding protein [Phytohabitans kaempferiae]|uniref:Dipeptide/oligopeptide/nickel ABC transporter permease/ATP-binding protein n=1 Tax=Phytohabitans kaempferiae TaxID=1620943 RepID=A0ABV6MAX7_9ACTN